MIDQNSRTDFYSELPNIIENQLIRGFQTVNELTKALSNVNDKIAKLDEYSKGDQNAYKTIIAGLLHGIIFDPSRVNDYFQYLFIINKDNFDFFLSTLISLIDFSHLKLSNQAYEQILVTFNKMIHMNSNRLVELMIMLLRVIFAGVWIHERIEFYKTLLRFIKSKLNWISASQNPFLAGLVFIKILRLMTENHFLAQNDPNYREILADESQILSKLWSLKREAILGIGKELIRCIIPIAKANIPEIKIIMEDIAKTSGNDNQLIYVHLLHSQMPFPGFNPYVHIHIPPMMERMLTFILTEVKKSNYVKYCVWMMRKFQIQRESERTILIDITRFIITCFNTLITKKSEITPRWLLLGYILKTCKNEVLSGEIKQAIFFDWLFFNKEKDHIYLIEPGLMVIFNSIREFSEMSMELIEFLDVYSENFDLNLKAKIRNAVSDAFRQAEAYQVVSSLKNIFKEDKINEDIKRIFEGLIKYNRNDDSSFNDSKEEIFLGNLDISPMNRSSNSMSVEEHAVNNKIISSGSGNKISKESSIIVKEKSKVIENEFFIHPNLDELMNPLTVKNFLNYKTKNMFKALLEDICKSYMAKLKSQNLLESKLVKIHPSQLDIHSSFAYFYLNVFKDELICNINPYEMENENSEGGSKTKNTVYLYLIDFMISKYSEKSDKEFSLLVHFVQKIIENYPNFIVKLFYYFSFKANKGSKNKLLVNKNLYYIFSKIFEDNVNIIKEKLTQLFITCTEYLDLEILNYFIENGFSIFAHLFTDESDLIFYLAMYSDSSSLNKIILDIQSSRYNLIEKELYKIVNNSLSLELDEQQKVWELILAHNNIPSMTNLKDFLRNAAAFSKNISLKKQVYLNFCNELFKNVIKCIKYIWPNEINEQNFVSNFFLLFDFPHFYSENVYNIFSLIQIKLSSQSVKPFQYFFFSLVDEYLRQVNFYQDKLHFLENFVKLLKELVTLDKNNTKPILIDWQPQPIFGLKNLKSKVDNLAKTFKIEIE